MTKTKEFKKYWIILKAKELLCYKDRTKQELKFMHSLTNTFVRKQ